MAIRPWKRMRDQADAGPDAPGDERSNPWGEAEVPRLGELGGHAMPSDPTHEELTGAKAEQYAMWQQRMHDKRARTRALVDRGAGDPSNPCVHWSTDALYAESRLVEEQETISRPNPWRTRELLSTLDLTEGASLDEVSHAYRRLAKTHHPDRFVGASAEVRDFHAKRMLDINAAYSSLKALLATGG